MEWGKGREQLVRLGTPARGILGIGSGIIGITEGIDVR